MSIFAPTDIPVILLLGDPHKELLRFADAASGTVNSSIPESASNGFPRSIIRHVEVRGRLITLLELTRHVNYLTLRDHCHFALLTALLYKHRIPLLGIVYRIDLETSCDRPFHHLLQWLADDSYPNVVFALNSSQARLRNLLRGPKSESTKLEALGKQLGAGSTIARFNGTHQSAVEVIERLIAIAGGPLSYQSGLVDQKKCLSQTGSLPRSSKASEVNEYFRRLEAIVPLILNAPAHQLIHIARYLALKLPNDSRGTDCLALHDAAQLAAKIDYLLAAQQAATSASPVPRTISHPAELSGQEKTLLEQGIVQAIELPDNEISASKLSIPRLPELEGSAYRPAVSELSPKGVSSPKQTGTKSYNEPWRALDENEPSEPRDSLGSNLLGSLSTLPTSTSATTDKSGLDGNTDSSANEKIFKSENSRAVGPLCMEDSKRELASTVQSLPNPVITSTTPVPPQTDKIVSPTTPLPNKLTIPLDIRPSWSVDTELGLNSGLSRSEKSIPGQQEENSDEGPLAALTILPSLSSSNKARIHLDRLGHVANSGQQAAQSSKKVSKNPLDDRDQNNDSVESSTPNALPGEGILKETSQPLLAGLSEAIGGFNLDIVNNNRASSQPAYRESHPLNRRIYRALAEDEIRLVTLRASSQPHRTLDLQISTVKLGSLPRFEALSYVVGDADLTCKASISDGSRTMTIHISRVMETILRHIRSPKEDKVLWIDAISIDQLNRKERSAQIQKMGQVFHAAANVLIWLGPASEAEHSDAAMDFISTVLDLDNLERSITDSRYQRQWLALATLMTRDWFRRRWVVQEMALARSATVHCGSRTVSWGDFASAAAIFESRWLEISSTLGAYPTDQLGDVHVPGASSLVRVSSDVFRKDTAGNILDRCYDLETLLTILPMFAVTEPLDFVYSILNLGRDTHDPAQLRIRMDYSSKTVDVFADVVAHVVELTESLDFICRPWAPSCDLPSWIPSIARYAYVRRYYDGQYERENADNLVGVPGRAIYAAAGRTAAKAEVCSGTGDGPRLRARGFFVGLVGTIGDRCVNGNIPGEWHEIGGWAGGRRPIPDDYWRTLVADRGTKGEKPPPWYASSCAHCFYQNPRRDLDTSTFIRRSKSANVKEYLRRVQLSIWNRRLLRVQTKLGRADNTGDSLRLGLGPAETQQGDSVVILYGCSVPLVVRRQAKRVDDGGRQTEDYVLVGECFVYGLMDSEALRHVQMDRTKEHDFCFV